MKKLILILSVTMLAMRSPAPIGDQPPVLSISLTLTNMVAVQETGLSPKINTQILQMTTSLTSPNWINIRTNDALGGAVDFDPIPATNPHAFFRSAPGT
jgi:hypothetical protein